jgi:beta-glucosidase
MPVAEADLPTFDNQSMTVTYDLFHGYRKLASDGTPARYPFGFGLTYTTFAYADLVLDRTSAAEGDVVTASITITNTGTVAAIETVQFYVAAPSTIERAPFELRAFTQVELAAGASQRIALPFRIADSAVFIDGAWTVEPGSYSVRVARHAEDPGPTTTFTVR